MGLDMYLTKRHYVKNWDFQTDDEKHQITVQKGGKPRTDINLSKISGIIEDVAYWRKANQIHAWFVENVQDGQDECRESYVEFEKLKELLNLINEALRNKDKAPELIPTQSGFFFGGTEYDEYYWGELQTTKEMIEREIAIEKNSADYYYHASW